MSKDGKHIKYQVYGAAFENLKDVPLVERLLTELVHASGMRLLDRPCVYDIRQELERMGVDPDPKEPEGVTGIVVLSTSHAAVHTWPHRGYAVVDVYSCADFDAMVVQRVLETMLAPRWVKAADLSHSLSLPPEPGRDSKGPSA